MLANILKTKKLVWERSPLIHSITNPISINDCANFVLTTGAKPIMAEHPAEVREITLQANALALNIANITDARMQSIEISAKTACEKGIPSIIDAVGVTCSTLRYEYITKLLSNTKVSAIKGNASEIKMLAGIKSRTIGIDVADKNGDIENTISAAKSLSKKYGCVIMASGSTDVICSEDKVLLVKNGRPEMSLVTGTGCIMNVLAASYMSVSDVFTGCAAAAVMLGICGETADPSNGMASYRNGMLDKFYTLTDKDISEHIKAEFTM